MHIRTYVRNPQTFSRFSSSILIQFTSFHTIFYSVVVVVVEVVLVVVVVGYTLHTHILYRVYMDKNDVCENDGYENCYFSAAGILYDE